MAKRRVRTDELITRPANGDDGPHLSSFRCSAGEWYEDEVEEYLHDHAISHVTNDGGFQYRLLLSLEEEKLIACGGHHVEPLVIDSGKLVEFIRLYVLAVDLENRGRRLEDGTSLADAMLRLTAADAMDIHGETPLTAIVANNNHRSMAVLERNGRWSQVRYGSRYVRFVGRMLIEK